MSESEQFEIQGRAHARLKQVQSKIATLSVALLGHVKFLRDLGDLAGQLVRDPSFKSSSYIKLSEHVKTEVKSAPTAEAIRNLVDELVRETEEAKALQAQIDRF